VGAWYFGAMRTHRLEVRVSKTEKERIEREAALLGTSTSEYVRKAATLLDAEDIVGMEDVRSLLPEFNAALTRIHDNLVAAAESREKAHQEIERMRTPEYREEVRREVAQDEAGLAAITSLLGFARTEGTPSEVEARASSRVAEPRAPWSDGEPPENGEESK
jgi:uncharacterized protein (DUF1778 family)